MANGETMMQEVNGHLIVISSNYDGGARTWGGFMDVGEQSMLVVRKQHCPLHVLSYLMQFATI